MQRNLPAAAKIIITIRLNIFSETKSLSLRIVYVKFFNAEFPISEKASAPLPAKKPVPAKNTEIINTIIFYI